MINCIYEAGAIVFRSKNDQIQILLIRSKKDPSKLVFPKGHIERGETEEETSKRELLEEAGVVGEFCGEAGTLEYRYNGKNYHVAFFLYRYLNVSGFGEPGRDPQWYNTEDALRLVLPNSRDLLSSSISAIKKNCNR